MEYIYAAMLLHKAKKAIDEPFVTKILEAAGLKTEPARVKALIAALDGVDIEKAIEKSAMPVAVAAPAQAEEKKEKPKKSEADEKKDEEKAAAGLGALFG